MILLPDSIEDYVDDNNSVRVIEAYINTLNLVNLGFAKPQPHGTGRPMYDPSLSKKRSFHASESFFFTGKREKRGKKAIIGKKERSFQRLTASFLRFMAANLSLTQLDTRARPLWLV